VLAFCDRLPEEGAQFKDFLKVEIDILNIKNLLRLKREGITAPEIIKYLFFSGKDIPASMLSNLANALTLKSMTETLQKTPYGKVISFEDTSSLINIELALHRHWLSKSFLYSRQDPLSVLTILGYLLGKEMEVKNLKTLIKAKQLGLAEDFIESKLVVS